jgi:RNA polymerase sigma-70 factor, ECF subfamily
MKKIIEQLYESELNRVFGFFMFKCSDRATAEDLTSQTFLSAFEQFENANKVIDDHKKYLYGVMKMVWLNYLKQKYSDPLILLEKSDDFDKFQKLDFSNESFLVERLLKYIDRLSDVQSTVIRYRFIEGYSSSDVQKMLGKDANYVKTTQKRALAKLRELVDKERSSK